MLSAIISTGMTERDLLVNTQNQTTKILLWAESACLMQVLKSNTKKY